MTLEELQKEREAFEQNIQQQYRILDEREAELEELRMRLKAWERELEQRQWILEQREPWAA